MAMPQRIETSRHYPHRDAFDADRAEMERDGWSVSATNERDVTSPALVRLVSRRRTHTEIDAVYTRETWPTGEDLR